MSPRRSESGPVRMAKESEMPRARSRNGAPSELPEDVAAIGEPAQGEGEALELDARPVLAAAAAEVAPPLAGSTTRPGVIRRPAATAAVVADADSHEANDDRKPEAA